MSWAWLKKAGPPTASNFLAIPRDLQDSPLGSPITRIPCARFKIERFANGYFRNGYFEFQCEDRRTFFRGLAGRPFLSEESSLFPPFLFLSGGVLGTFHGFSKYPFAKYPFASF